MRCRRFIQAGCVALAACMLRNFRQRSPCRKPSMLYIPAPFKTVPNGFGGTRCHDGCTQTNPPLEQILSTKTATQYGRDYRYHAVARCIYMPFDLPTWVSCRKKEQARVRKMSTTCWHKRLTAGVKSNYESHHALTYPTVSCIERIKEKLLYLKSLPSSIPSIQAPITPKPLRTVNFGTARRGCSKLKPSY